MASVKQAWIKKYGEVEGLMRWNEHKKKFGRTHKQLREQYGDDYVKELAKKKASHSLEACIQRYGEIEGPLKWKERLSKKIETQRRKRESGHRYKNGRTLEEYQERYGIDEGYNRWKRRNERQAYRFSKQFYIDEYGNVEGIIRWKEYKKTMDKTSLEAFQTRYGKEEGQRRYDERCKKCAITELNLITKYGEDIGKQKYNEWIKAVTASTIRNTEELFTRGVSKISQKLFHELYETIDDLYQEKCYFAELNQEYSFFVNHENGYPNKIIRVDFKCGNAIIEYDGEYWHNEELDRQRDKLLISKGYRILRIPGKRYNTDPELVINQCKEFIYENA